MRKQITAWLLILALVPALAGCGKKDETPEQPAADTPAQSQQSTPEEKPEPVSPSGVELTQEFTFAGYRVLYPADARDGDTDRGTMIGDYDGNYCIILETPAAAGILTEVGSLEEAQTFCQEYMLDTLEGRVRSRFDIARTAQKISSSAEVTHNGVTMLRVDGVFVNEKTDMETEFVALYLLSGGEKDYPVYIVGVQMADGYDIVSLMDAVAQNVQSAKK